MKLPENLQYESLTDDSYNFRRMLETVENRVGAINHPNQESRRRSAYAPRFIMIIGGLIKTLRYNASG